MKVCDKTCIFFFFPIINKYFLMAKRSYFLDAPRISIFKFLGFHIGVDEPSGLQSCDIASLGDWFPVF